MNSHEADGMDLATFAERLDRWGCDLETWPDADARRGRALVAADPGAAEALARATTLDELLATLPPALPPPTLRERVLAAKPPAPAATALDHLLGWLQAAVWRPVAVSAMALAVGFLIGALQPQPEMELYAEELALLAIDEFEDLPYEN